MTIQPFADLDDATEAALRDSIRRFGVLMPVLVDQDGRLLDGHQRERIARDLGVECPRKVRAVVDDADAWAVAVSVNQDRRHLTPEQRIEVVAELRRKGHSTRAIAGAVGASQRTVRRDLDRGEAHDSPDEVTGRDGKSYPAHRQPATVTPDSDPSRSRHLSA